MEHQIKHRRQKGPFFAVTLIVFGLLFLLERLGVVERHLFAQWWPVLPIILGSYMLITRLGNRNN